MRIVAATVTAAAMALSLSACNSQQKTEELIQAKLEAEKAKEIATQYQELKVESEQLRKENEALKIEVATLTAKNASAQAQASQRRVATRTPTKAETKPAPRGRNEVITNPADASPAEREALKQQVTGGSSLK